MTDTTRSDQEKLADACLWFRHDFGLLGRKDQDRVLSEAAEWLSAFDKAGLTPAPREDGYSAGVRAAADLADRCYAEGRMGNPGHDILALLRPERVPDMLSAAHEIYALKKRHHFDKNWWPGYDMAYHDFVAILQPTPACTATDGPASACVYRAPGLGTNEYGDDIPGRIPDYD